VFKIDCFGMNLEWKMYVFIFQWTVCQVTLFPLKRGTLPPFHIPLPLRRRRCVKRVCSRWSSRCLVSGLFVRLATYPDAKHSSTGILSGCESRVSCLTFSANTTNCDRRFLIYMIDSSLIAMVAEYCLVSHGAYCFSKGRRVVVNSMLWWVCLDVFHKHVDK
jgi:hypothetical protein